MLRLISAANCRSLDRICSPHVRHPYSTRVLAAGYKPLDVERDEDVQRSAAAHIPTSSEKYSFILPPPNVTGNLHLGHALMCTIQDVLARHRRGRRHGNDVRWIPGTDHAGIATQVVVEKNMRALHGLGRHQLGRERFLAEVWRWRDTHGHRIRDDLQRLGASADWTREFFTLDAAQSRAVRTAFVRLFDEGLVYREGRLVNWSCALESTISDIEVDVLPLSGPTALSVPGYEKPIVFGELTELAYAVCDGAARPSGAHGTDVVVATTRPETMLGDVAVAVHPADTRYSHLRPIGGEPHTMLWHALREERIPLVFDEAVDPAFGTGAVKITPAHDRFDYELARRHGLPTTLAVINERGTICTQFGDAGVEAAAYRGMPRFAAREAIKDRLAELGRLGAVRPHTMQLPVCSRSRDIVELLLRPQWYVRCAEMAGEAQQAVRTGALRMEPAHFEADWHRWLGEARDWCVSRQLWWGHRIPAYECSVNGSNDARSVWVAAEDETDARLKAAKQLNISNATAIDVTQDEDVLDTWFSAALLPFSAVGWPDESAADFRRYYPHDVLVTGHDILFFWVARMVMLGQRLTGRVPFERVLLHGIVCDAHGRKMSKSLGNVVTPAQVIEGATLDALRADTEASHAAGVLTAAECARAVADQRKLFPNGIPACGTDALRFTLCAHNVKSHFVAFDVHECHTNKLFFNKIWQATRFTVAAHEKWPQLAVAAGELPLTAHQLGTMDRWMLSRLARTRRTVATAIDAFQLHVATAALKTFFYQNLCDVYVETTKAGIGATDDGRLARGHLAVLSACLHHGLKELAVFAPFVCGELLQQVRVTDFDFADDVWLDDALERDVDEMLAICAAVRQLQSERNITRKHRPIVHIHISDASLLERLQRQHTDDMRVLSLCTGIRLSGTALPLQLIAQSTAGAHCTFGIEVSADAVRQLQDTESGETGVNGRKRQRLEQDLRRLESTVSNEGYRRSASARVQQQHGEKIERIRAELASIRQIA